LQELIDLKIQEFILRKIYKLIILFLFMDYGCGEKRKTKKDLKMKRKLRAYKRGGKFRCSEISKDKK
jgi:hypothetical protein